MRFQTGPTLLISLVCLVAQGCKSLDGGAAAPSTQTAALPSLLPPFQPGRYSKRELCVATAERLATGGHVAEAIKLYEKAEGLDPEADKFDLELAPLYSQAGDTRRAIERYRRVITAGEAGADVYNNLAWTLSESGSPAEALQTIEQGLAVESTNKRLQATKGIALYHLGRRDEAFDLFRQLYGAPAAHHNLALLDIEAGSFGSAADHARLAAQSPDSPPAARDLHEALQTRLASAEVPLE